MKKPVYVLIAVSLVLVLLPAAATALFANETTGEGCTPGYWKQPQHFDSWVNPPYDPGASLFDVMFEVDCKDMACEGKTLLEVLQTGGGGEKALGRHAVAALLNASHPDVGYEYSVIQIKAMVQHAYATGDFEGIKNLFAYENELDCPLGRPTPAPSVGPE